MIIEDEVLNFTLKNVPFLVGRFASLRCVNDFINTGIEKYFFHLINSQLTISFPSPPPSVAPVKANTISAGLCEKIAQTLVMKTQNQHCIELL